VQFAPVRDLLESQFKRFGIHYTAFPIGRRISDRKVKLQGH